MNRGGRTIAAPLYTPSLLDRSSRHSLARRSRAIEAASRRAEFEQRRARLRAERHERRAARYLPAGGEPGPDALRSYRRFRVQAHRATSEVLGAAYPFLAEAGLGAEGLFIGQDAWSGSSFCYDPWVLYRTGVLTNPNGLLAGVVGKGKSTLAKSLATRSIAFGRKVYVPGDPKGEWTVVAQAVGGQAIELGGGLATRLNPFDEGPRSAQLSDDDWRIAVAARRRDLLRASPPRPWAATCSRWSRLRCSPRWMPRFARTRSRSCRRSWRRCSGRAARSPDPPSPS